MNKDIKLITGMLIETADNQIRLIWGDTAITLSIENPRGGFDISHLDLDFKDIGNHLNDVLRIYS